MSLVDRVRSTIAHALHGIADADVLSSASWAVERPKRAEHGDLATNVALVITKKVGKPPRAIAEHLVKALEGNDVIAKAEIAGPGFVNLRLHPTAFHDALTEILVAGKSYGRAPSGSGERINMEFVSANPTGPLLVSHGRGAIFGDAIARLLEATGNRVTREYYINDFGNQVRLFAASVKAIAQGLELPEGGYKGAYITELATYLKKIDPAVITGDEALLSRACVAWMLRGIPGSNDLRGIKTTLRDLGVEFDVWFSEESLHRWGNVDAALRQLQGTGYLVETDGALFFKAEEGADDKDRVVRKRDGTYTYFASDIAYFADKISRGYDRLLITLGADHHGYVARVRNSLAALGLPSERFEALLYQLVFLFRDGEPVKFSKRQGNIVTIEEVIEEIDEAAGRKGAGSDALRFFFLSRSANSNVEFDIEIAKKKSLENPVFYVQYGHARLASILKAASDLGFKVQRDLTREEWKKLEHPEELAIAQKVAEWPFVLADAAKSREPHKLVFYIQELANVFQSYYTRFGKADPILPKASTRAQTQQAQGDGWEKSWDHEKTRARLAWVEAIRVVYASALGVLGVSAPERMDLPVTLESGEGGVSGESAEPGA